MSTGSFRESLEDGKGEGEEGGGSSGNLPHRNHGESVKDLEESWRIWKNLEESGRIWKNLEESGSIRWSGNNWRNE